jgi:hypothetical protein
MVNFQDYFTNLRITSLRVTHILIVPHLLIPFKLLQLHETPAPRRQFFLFRLEMEKFEKYRALLGLHIFERHVQVHSVVEGYLGGGV